MAGCWIYGVEAGRGVRGRLGRKEGYRTLYLYSLESMRQCFGGCGLAVTLLVCRGILLLLCMTISRVSAGLVG